MKKISTKNLYLATLMQISNEEWNPFTFETITHFNKEKRYLFVKKKNEIYIDIFTGTELLKVGNPKLQQGDWCIRKLHPLITDYKYISKEVLSKALQELNPIIFKKSQKEKYKILKLTPKHNEESQ